MLGVVCKVEQCPYRSKSRFCKKRLVSITEQGLCGHIYNKNGQIKPNWQEKIDQECFQEEEENGIK